MLSERAISIRNCLSTAERLRSARLMGHEDRVGRLCAMLGGIMGFDPGHLVRLRYAAGLHDVGKLAISDTILNKPGRLNPDEWEAMRRHSEFGYQILRETDDPTVIFAADIALQHHECWDGSGYPAGLKGDAIMREARIVGLCDIYDAMREERPYKAPISHEEVVHTILHGDARNRTRPSLFDPELLAVMAADAEPFRIAFDAVSD